MAAPQRRSLLQQLDEIRRQRYALVNDKSLGVPIGQPAAAGLAVAGSSIKRNLSRLVERLHETADAIAQDLAR